MGNKGKWLKSCDEGIKFCVYITIWMILMVGMAVCIWSGIALVAWSVYGLFSCDDDYICGGMP